MIEIKPTQIYIDCDTILYEYTPEWISKEHPKFRYNAHCNLGDKKTLCNSGLWRDGSFSNALHALNTIKCTDALHLIENGKEILTITRKTPKQMYIRSIHLRKGENND